MDLRQIERAAKKQGFTVGRTSKGHPQFIAPNGERAVFAGTPSDHRAVKNFVAHLRRLGFVWPPPHERRPSGRKER